MNVFQLIRKCRQQGLAIYDFSVRMMGLKSTVRHYLLQWYILTTAGLAMDYKLGPRWEDVITWSDFKSETSFGFPSPTTWDNVLDFFCKT